MMYTKEILFNEFKDVTKKINQRIKKLIHTESHILPHLKKI